MTYQMTEDERDLQNIRDMEDERDHLDDAPDWPPYDVCAYCGPLTYVQAQGQHDACGEARDPDEDGPAPIFELSGPDRGRRLADIPAAAEVDDRAWIEGGTGPLAQLTQLALDDAGF